MAEESETIEDAAATLLNGVMITLLGAALPVLFVWRVVHQWGRWTVGLDTDSVAAAGQICALMLFSFLFLRTGCRMVWKGVTALRRRRHRLAPR